MGQSLLIMLLILALGVVGRNYIVAYAAGAMLLLQLLHLDSVFAFLERNAINVGIGLITIAILVPFAAGRIGWSALYQSLVSPVGLIAFATGIFVAYLGGRGVGYLSASPQVMVGLMAGTILGVAFFRGVPVGPLIAAGIVALIMGLWNK